MDRSFPIKLKVRLSLAAVLLLAAAASAEDLELRGHAKYQAGYYDFDSGDLLGELGADESVSHALDLRGIAEWRSDAWAFDLHGEVLGAGGDRLKALKRSREILPNPIDFAVSDRRRLFDLTADPIDDDDFTLATRIDRASAAWTGDHHLVRAGRQALTWGNALLFPVMDLFNPFAPTQVDKDYKTGDDMLFGQYLFTGGQDLQALVVPRRDPDTHAIKEDESSFALKWHAPVSSPELDVDLLAARHYDETVVAAGFNKSVLDGVLRSDLSLTQLEDSETSVSMLVNYDRSWTIFEKNVYAFIEYYYSGVGDADGDYTDLDPELIDRIGRAEIFQIGRDYIGTGGRIEFEPRYNLFINQIFNLHDESGFFQLRNEFDLAQNVLLMLGANVPYGTHGSEFGGIPTGVQDTFLYGGREIFLRLSVFF